MRKTSTPNDSQMHPAETGTQPLVESLVELARTGLPRMFNSQERLFCFTLRRNAAGTLEQLGVSHRYTMMTLLGLHRLEEAGTQSPIEIKPVVDALLRDLAWITSVGDLGVLLWLCSVVAPERLDELTGKLDLNHAVESFQDGRRRSTTELAWFLAGLAHVKIAMTPRSCVDDSIATRIYRLLVANQGPHGIFGHLAADRSLSGRLRGPLGSFADQVYPIYALAHFGRAFYNYEAIRHAQDCAAAIVRLQGPDGEWWWHYNAKTGSVSRPYPIYSVHQDGMAPMALFALAQADGQDFSEPVRRGLRWIPGANALGTDMRDPDNLLIWRCIAPNSLIPRVQEMAHLALGTPVGGTNRNQKVVHECRPYELGWALYALTPRLQRAGTIGTSTL